MTFANVEQRNKNLICQFFYLQALPFAGVEKNGRERTRKMYDENIPLNGPLSPSKFGSR